MEPPRPCPPKTVDPGDVPQLEVAAEEEEEEEEEEGEPLPGRGPASDVFLAASAPSRAAPGSLLVVRFAAYADARREATLALLRQLSPASETYADVRTCRWADGTRVRVRMTLMGTQAAPVEEEFVWRSASNIVDFPVEVPALGAPSTLMPRLEVLVEGVRVASIVLTVVVGSSSAPDERMTVSTTPARTAFASYAHEDRQRVLDRLASVRIAAGLEIWLDHLSLVPSQVWKDQIERKIATSDLFLLFWSLSAKESEWVTWEWKLALAKKPRDRFQVHPLEYAPPPPELADLQMDDVLMTLRGASDPA